jgi:hypothetical protein
MTFCVSQEIVLSAQGAYTACLSINACNFVGLICVDHTDGVSTLSWWRDLRAPETLRAMPAVA